MALLDLQHKEPIFLILILWLSGKGDTQLHITIRKATAAKGSKIPKPGAQAEGQEEVKAAAAAAAAALPEELGEKRPSLGSACGGNFDAFLSDSIFSTFLRTIRHTNLHFPSL